MTGSSDDEDLDSFLKSVKNRRAAEFQRQVKCASELALLNRAAIDIVEPEGVELEQEFAENVPTGVDADECQFYMFRVRTELPQKYLHRATVTVSIICNKNCGARSCGYFMYIHSNE